MKKELKLAFFVKQGLDSFLGDIITNLSTDYEAKKIIVTEAQQIDEGMKWADICWFEWCDELIVYGSKHELAKDKKIIVRLHSYEAFTLVPAAVNWDNVDELICVGQHIKEFIISKFKIKAEIISVIPNGIDVNKYTYKECSPGFNVAYVGYINYKKGPMLLLHTFKALYEKDNRYRFFIAGTFQDERDILYFNQMIKEMNLENNIRYDGWQDDLDNWLEDKNYILCTSVLESQNVSVMQAMAKGIKPVIHNFVGAKSVYNQDYLWNTMDEAVQMISSKTYNSHEYRNFVEEKYSFSKQVLKIKEVIHSLTITQ